MRPEHTSACGLTLLVHAALIYYCIRPQATADSALRRLTGTEQAEDAALGIEAYPPLTHQLTPHLVTFSTVPRPRWQTLANLENIKKRNRPLEPPKAPEQVSGLGGLKLRVYEALSC
jgi:hypothetical protein